MLYDLSHLSPFIPFIDQSERQDEQPGEVHVDQCYKIVVLELIILSFSALKYTNNEYITVLTLIAYSYIKLLDYRTLSYHVIVIV